MENCFDSIERIVRAKEAAAKIVPDDKGDWNGHSKRLLGVDIAEHWKGYSEEFLNPVGMLSLQKTEREISGVLETISWLGLLWQLESFIVARLQGLKIFNQRCGRH